jgi:hypothetical protein
LITLKVLKFQSIQTLSIQTLRKIYREVREAGSWPSHTHAPPCGAETAGRAPRPAITFPFAADPISPNTITGRTTILWLAWQLFVINRRLQTSPELQTTPESPDIPRLRTHAAIPTNSPLLEACEIASQWPGQPHGKACNPHVSPDEGIIRFSRTYSPATPR